METTKLKGYEALTMLTRRQQRRYFEEVLERKQNIDLILYDSYDNVYMFLAHSFIWEGSIYGANYWGTIAKKYIS